MNKYCLLTLWQNNLLIETKSVLCPNDYDDIEKCVLKMLTDNSKEVHVTHFYMNGEVREINYYYFKDILYKDNSLYIIIK